MISQIKITFWWLMPLFLVYHGMLSHKESEFKEVKHTVSIKHPGEKSAIKATLTEVQNTEGLPIEYFMDVESVICLAEVCKVIPVKLYWNNIGEYQKYELQDGATLEKYESDLFEPNDYKKIHAILQNQNSPFKDVYIEDIWTVPSTLNEEIDAISGATILELDEKDTVPGAALTCYTLWHWANGNIVSVIKNKTSESVSNEQLIEFIINKNKTYFNIALSALKQRNIYQDSFVDVIIQRVLKDDFLLKEAFTYLENAPLEIYLKSSSELFFKGKKAQKLYTIQSLNNLETEISKSFFDDLSKEVTQLGSFQEVSTLFELMQNKNPNSSIVNNNVLPLLNSDFLIARSAYWFLNHQKLTSKQQKKLRKFRKKNKERL